MVVYRIQKAKYKDILTADGSTFVDGRWHKALPGLPMLYTSESKSLAILEILVHIGDVSPKPIYQLFTLDIPDNSFELIQIPNLPKNWNLPNYDSQTQQWGSNWLRACSSLAIGVPSTISGDINILINPLHKDYSKVKIQSSKQFDLDSRLFVK